MRTIKQQHQAIYEPIADLSTYRALPTRALAHLDPFLLLNHHGPQEYEPNNKGLPFGPHPHRGFETLTFILQGDLVHQDSQSGQSVIGAGGAQWMTAGSGLIHAEVSSEAFKREGGVEEVVQLWLNLPSHLKMTTPRYFGLQQKDIPVVNVDAGRVGIHLISGRWNDVDGPVPSLTGLFTASVAFEPGGTLRAGVDAKRNILFYVVRGELSVNGEPASAHTLIEFDNDGEELEVRAHDPSLIIFAHGEPFHEPIVSHGPFVMNSRAEIRQAMLDYQSGRMGAL
jgi:redox-sensitive bicupin YhaK (pirin superfamily)